MRPQAPAHPAPEPDLAEVDPPRLRPLAGAAGRQGSGGATGHRRRRRRWRRALALGAGTLVVVSAAGACYLAVLPNVTDAPALVAARLQAHGGQLGPLPLPGRLAEAVVAVEDEHFYSNVFLNVAEGAARAAVASLERGGDPGGSTIEQQLAKQLYPHGPGLGGTLEEIGLGVKLALTFSKPKILEMYLNAIYYGNGYWGDVAAARGYFGTSPDHLTWAEAALLAGLPQAPSAYDPLHHLALAKARQRHVLTRLVANGILTPVAAQAAARAVLPLRRSPPAA